MSTSTGSTVEQIMAELDARHEKTASVQAETPSVDSDLATHRQELDQALSTLITEPKTAAATDPLENVDATAYVEKMAAEIETAEAHALVKEAELFAGAFFHSFLNHANEYASAAGTKVAAQAAPPQPQPQPQLSDADAVHHIKTAASTGASDAAQLFAHIEAEKTAAQQSPAAYADGAEQMMEKIADACHDSFNMGFADVEAAVGG